MDKLAVCIPTYNRSDAVAEVLRKEVCFLKKNDVSLYIYDSSTGKETKKVTEQYRKEGYGNLFYKWMESSIPANEKVYRIYEEMSESGYDYIWVIHDHTVFTEEALQSILKQLALDSDFYLLKMQSGNFAVTGIPSLDEFLLMGAWTLNSIGTAIIKVSTFLNGVNWRYMSHKYLTAQTIRYSHIGFYFERASELEMIRMTQLEFPREDFYDFMRYEKPSWDKETIEICLECWGETITRLPDIYKNKKETLLTQDKWFLSKYKLIEYKKEKLYNFSSFVHYRKWMKQIIPDRYIKAFWIAILPYGVCEYIFSRRLLYQINHMRKEKRKICIYGAGRHALECANFLESCRVPLDAFLVTKLDANPDRIRNHPVLEADSYLKQEKAFVIIAILTSGVQEVAFHLKQIGRNGGNIKYISFEE